MLIYVSDARNSATLVNEARRMGCRHMVEPKRYRPQRIPYALDNGAFGAFIRGQPLDEDRFYAVLDRAASADILPDFVVVPDLVAAGMQSLEYSLEHVQRIPESIPRYLAVQDGMTAEAVRVALHLFDGLFVGGSLPWKYRTAPEWVELAHSCHKPCHIGRIGTIRGYEFAYAAGADSVDGSNPVRNRRMDIIERWRRLCSEQVRIGDHRWQNLCEGLTGH